MAARRTKFDREALLRKLKAVRGLYASAAEAVVVTRPEGKLDCNQAILKLFGYRRKADYLATSRGETSPARQPDGRRSTTAARAYHDRALRDGYVRYDWVFRRRDGTEFPAEVVLAALELDGVKLVRAAVRDLTAQRRAEAELAASEARFRSLADTHPIPFAVTSATEDRFLYVSDAAAQMYRVPRARLMKMRPGQFWVDPGSRKQGREALRRGVKVDAQRVRMRRGDGSEYWVSLSGQMIEFDGAPALAASMRDLTNEMAADAALRESEERFRELVSLHPVPMTIFDRGYRRYHFVSPAYAELLGMSVEQVMASRPGLLWADRAERRQAEQFLRAHGHMEGYEVHLRRQDGGELWAAATVKPVQYRGTPAWLTALTDITQRKRMEAALRESEERFRQIAELHPVPMVINDREWSRYLYVSPAAARMLRTTPEDMLEMAPAAFWPDPEDMRAAGTELYRRGSLDDYEARLRCVDGEEIWISATIRPVEYRGAAAWLNALVDVTARRRMQAALRESEERFRQIAELHPVPMAITDREFRRYLYVSPAAARLLLTTPEAMLQGSPAQFWADPLQMRRAGEYLAEHGAMDDFEAQVLRTDGEPVWISATVRPVEYDGKPAWLNALVDVSARKRAETALRESEERFRAMAEAAPVGIAVHSAHHPRMLYLNAAFAAIYRTTREDLLSRSLADGWVNQGDRARLRQLMLQGHAVDEFVALHNRSDGSNFWAALSARPVVYQGMPCWISTIRDLTDQRAAEAALRDSERRFRELLEQHPSPMVVTSAVEDRILYVSKAGERLLGMTAEEILAKPASWFWADPADRERVRETVLAGGVIDELEVRLRRADGEYWASLSGRVFEYDGAPALFMTGRDLTRQKENEAEIERQRAALEQSAKMAAMGSLLASVSHELNNPLAVVMAQAELLKELAAGSSVADRADTIHTAAERCARIVRTFLALARQKPPAARAYDLNAVAQSAVELLGYGLKSAGVAVRLDLAKDLPALHGDADQMAQVLSNLVINAQQAMQSHAGPRRLVVATRRAGSGKRVRLRVTDSGPGVPREIRSRIFEPFFTTKPIGTGTGIGLALCHNIVAAHGGTISVEDAPGGGTRFVIVLPVAPVELDVVAKGPARADAVQAQAILVVDDEPQLLATMADILAPLATRVDRAANGREALKLIERNGYDAVLSDLRMPDMDGPALHAAIAVKRPELSKRVVFVTGDSLGIGVEEFLEKCGAPVLEKPFSADDLRRTVGRVLALRRTAIGKAPVR
jgi:PAS domain S-box-containing protein